MKSMVSDSNLGILNWDSPNRLPGNANPSSPDVSLASAFLITSTNRQTKTNLGSDHLQTLISLQMDVNINPIQHHSSINLKSENLDRYSRAIEDKLRKRRLPTYCLKEKRSCVPLFLKQHHTTYPLDNTEPVPTDILKKMRARDDLRSKDSTSPVLQQMNDEITRITSVHNRHKWRQFVDHKTDPTKLWRTIKIIIMSYHQTIFFHRSVHD